MISFILLILHAIFLIYIFIVKAKESFSEAFINLGLIVIIFSIGWTICTAVSKMIFPGEGFGENFTQDDISLLLLSIAEIIFYKMYYKDLFTGAGKEK